MLIADVLHQLGFTKGASPCGKASFLKSALWGHYTICIIPDGNDDSRCVDTQAKYLIYSKENTLLAQKDCHDIFEAIRSTLMFTHEEYINELNSTLTS